MNSTRIQILPILTEYIYPVRKPLIPRDEKSNRSGKGSELREVVD
jgi:hypothetical protein